MSRHHWFYIPLASAAVAIICVASWFFVQTERAAQTLIGSLTKTADQGAVTLSMVNAALRGTHKNGDDGLLFRASLLVDNAQAAANALKQTAQTVNAVTKANQPSTAKVSAVSLDAIQAGRDSLVKLGDAIGALDAVVSDMRTVTLPKVNDGIDSLNFAVKGLQPVEANASILLASGSSVMTAAHDAVDQATRLIADPDLTAVARNMNVASGNLAGGMLHLNNALGYVEYDLKPVHVSFWRSLAEGALSSAIGIPLKYMPTRVAVTSSVPVKAAQ